MTQFPVALSELSDRYDVILSDVWGVIHNGRESFGPACAALARWRREVGPVILISNAPRPAAAVHSQLDELGVSRDVWTDFVTSGDATRELLRAASPGPSWRIGPARDAPLYDGLGMAFASAEQARLISITGPDDDDVETPEDYRTRLEVAAERKLVMICANPDKVVQRGDRLIYCAGAIADLYVELGGEVRMAGKPNAPIYDLALSAASQALGRPVDRRRVLCVGDGLPTDVLGANRQGLDCLFILGGINGDAGLDVSGRADPDKVAAILVAAGCSASYAMAELE